MKHIIAVLLENEPGALSRVVGLFSARGYNIESLTVAPTEDASLSRMTIQTTGSDDVIIATAKGKLARFSESEVRAMGRDAAGVIGIRLARQGDSVVGMSVVQPESDLLVLTETGYGKRVPLTEFRRKHRGGQGVGLISLEGRKTGDVAAVQQVTEADEELLLISAGGQVIRTETNTINRYSSGARGVIVMRLAEGDRVVAIAAFRAGLAERDAMGDDGAPGSDGGGSTDPGTGG